MTANLERHIAAFAADPGDAHAFGLLEEGYFFAGDWDALVALYRERLAAPGLADKRERAGLHYRLGQVLEERCLDLDLAIEQYTRAVQLDSRYPPALRQLRQAHSRREAWDLVLQIAELEIETLREPYERAVFFAEMGDVWLRRLGDTNEALTCFQQSLAIDPQHKDALAGLARTLEAQGNSEAAAATWERLIGCVRGPDRALPLVSLARLLSGPLHQQERAVDLYRRALGDDPRNEAAVEALSIAAAARGQWELLADLYERRFGLAAGARRRTAIALEAGYMQLEQRGNLEAARIWFERAREMSGDDETVLTAWVELERESGDTDALAAALDRLIDACGRRTPLRFLTEAAGVHTERADDERALQVLELAQRQAPDDPLVLEMLGATYAALLRYDDCASVLERRAALCEEDADTRAGILIELGYVQATQLADIPAAQDAYERAFAACPDRPGLAGTLEALYRKTESFDALRRLLERAAQSGPEDERAAYYCSLGELLETRFGEPEASAACFEASLDRGASPRALQGLSRLAARSGDPEAMRRALEREAAISTDPDRLAVVCLDLCARCESEGDLEAALAWAKRSVAATPDSRPGLEVLARMQEVLGHAGDLARTLEQLAERVDGPGRTAVRRRIAQLHERSGNSDSARVWWEATLESDADDLDALAALERHYRAEGRWEELAKVLRRLADRAPEAERAGPLDALARVLDEQLADLDAAIVVLWRLADAPGRPQDASQRLENLLERAGRFEELAQQLLERRRSLPDDDPEALALELRRAWLLLDPLGQYEEAANAFRSVRLRAPDRVEATEGLEHALRAANDGSGLARLLEELAAVSTDPTRSAELRFERAVLLEESLGELEQARQAYALLCDSGDEPIALQAGSRLDSLLERCGDWTALRARLEDSARRGAGTQRLELHERIARLCMDRMDDPEAAAFHLEESARIDPGRPDPWRLLGSLYHELQRGDDLLRVIRGELETGPDPERERVLRARAAELWLRRPGEEDNAGDHYERLLELDPGRSDATEYLVDRYESQGRHADVVRLLEGRLAAVEAAAMEGSDGLLSSLRLRIASLRVEELGDREGAIPQLEAALAADGPGGPAAEPLADLYRETGRRAELVALCEDAARATSDPDERILWLQRLGAALRETGESERAIDTWRQVLAERPDDERAYAALCDLYRAGGDAAALARLLEQGLPRRSGAMRIGVRMELARLLEEDLERPSEALEQLAAVIEQDRDHEAAFQQALALAHRLERHDQEIALVDARLERPVSQAERVELLERRADLLAGPLAAPEAAVSAYREVVSLAPDRSSARRSLRQALEGLGRWTAVLDCLYVDAQSVEPAERAAIFERAAEIAAAQVGQDAALPWLERLRAARPGDPLILARIADVHRLAGRFESVLRAIEDELAITTDPEHARDLHVGRGRILERDLDAPGRAVGALEAARALAPEDPEILARLDDLYARTGRPRERSEVLEARLRVCPPEARLALHLSAADLYGGDLAEPERAIPHLLHAVSLTRALEGGAGARTPSTPEARIALLGDLARALRSAGRVEAWARAAGAELRALNQDLADRTATPGDPRIARRNVLHRELAWAHGDRLANPSAALHHLRILMAYADEGDLAGLDGSDFDEIERRLVDLLRRDANWVELEERLSTRVGRGSGTADEWLELARLRDERLHAPRAARDAYARTLALRPDSLAAIRGLRDLSERLADWPGLGRALELERAHPDGRATARRGALSRRLGEVAWRRLHDPERAVAAFEDALDADGGDLEAMRALEQLHEERDAWETAAELYEREARALADADPERRREAWLAAAALRDRRGDDPRRALRAYEEAAALGPLEPADLRAQADLYQRLGDQEAFARTWAQWCDDERSGSGVADHLELVETLVGLERPDQAIARCRRATELDGESADAWARLARLLHDQERTREAADAWEEAGERRRGPEAARHLCDAARLVESTDLPGCARRLRRAIARDPGSAGAHAQLARVAAALRAFEESEEAATRALDLSAAAGASGLGQSLERDTALVGGRAARALDRLESAVLFYAAALDRDPANPEALEAYGELLFERGDLAAARGALEARIELGSDDRHAERLAMLGSVLELAGEPEAALDRFRQAVARDASCGAAHAGVARLCEKADRVDEAVGALEAWGRSCRVAGDRAGCAARHLRAAELELARGHDDDARLQLHACLAADPRNARAWVLLVETLAETDRSDEILRRVPEALCLDEVEAVPDAVARLSLLYARALERRGDTVTACEAYAEAVSHDARCAEAALARARLLRARGEWQQAVDCLRAFCEGHPEPDHRDLAEVHYKLARLLAGPLEDMQGAIRCFERALEIAPDHPRAREPLASLLSVMPERWQQAVTQHVALLHEEPTRATSIRALVRIARARHDDDGARFGLALLRAIGAASPSERSDAPPCLPALIAPDPALEDPNEELARRLVQHAAEALEQVLPADPSPDEANGDFVARRDRALRELSAPGLESLSDAELGDLLATLAAMALGDEADRAWGQGALDASLARKLDRALGRWTRRKMRRLLEGSSFGAIETIDAGHWRIALRGLAAAVAVDLAQGELREALLRLCDVDVEAGSENDDLSDRIQTAPEAAELLRRAASGWCRELLES